ncbi:uncharacterized protein LOC129534903 isoform X1 [Moschus berezovskii]|uniref:uncharacterized protein LOC129534903 isoform X1 n=1 Tax=Moschus berezovskii TaxID=68408 RepID=UPI002444270D|nr:uncharacterized protein LOC129534903 isoform X1 [Moschus berezovskii]
MPVTKRDGLARRWGRVFSGVEHVIGDASRKRWAGMRCSAGSGGRAVEASERGRPRGRSGRGSKHGNGPPASHPRPPFRCGPLGGDLAQALLFSRTAYDCSPQCLLPASPLEVKTTSFPAETAHPADASFLPITLPLDTTVGICWSQLKHPELIRCKQPHLRFPVGSLCDVIFNNYLQELLVTCQGAGTKSRTQMSLWVAYDSYLRLKGRKDELTKSDGNSGDPRPGSL